MIGRGRSGAGGAPRKLRAICAIAILSLAGACAPDASLGSRSSASSPAAEPKLVLIVVVDQLPQERWWSLLPRFGPDGFNRLAREGRSYTNAHYDHGTTFTAVGHAAIVTGVLPRRHGIVANEWVDRSTGAKRYSVVSRKDPSPDTLLVPTVGELIAARHGTSSRVWAVSIKERAAVILAGKSGTALWFDRDAGRFRIRRPAGKAPPGWTAKWTSTDPSVLAEFLGAEWSLSRPEASYRISCDETGVGCPGPGELSPWAPDAGEFPKRMPEGSAPLAKMIRRTPFGDRMTLDLALDLLRHEYAEGADDYGPDLLAVSFSCTDYIGHRYGPDSLEYEDQLLKLDLLVAELLSFIDVRVGLDRTLVFFTSDHGADSATAYHRQLGQPTGRLIGEELVARMNAKLRERTGVDADLVQAFSTPGFYLDPVAVDAAGLDRSAVADLLAELLSGEPGVGSVFVWSETGPVRRYGTVDWYDALVERAFHRDRSGDVIVVPEAHVFYDSDDDYAAMHGTPFPYDTGVPLVVMGGGYRPGAVSARVWPRQIASTIAELLDVEPGPGWAESLP